MVSSGFSLVFELDEHFINLKEQHSQQYNDNVVNRKHTVEVKQQNMETFVL